VRTAYLDALTVTLKRIRKVTLMTHWLLQTFVMNKPIIGTVHHPAVPESRGHELRGEGHDLEQGLYRSSPNLDERSQIEISK
jgi:hypothetical protein